ncbi:MAG: RNB domain-containing ribonuclease [Candidatus Eisenbacteria bacterium]
MSIPGNQQRSLLARIAREAMLARGFQPDFTPEALAAAEAFVAPRGPYDEGVRDLRALPWCSIDNDDSRDLDQLSVAVEDEGGTRVLVAIADVSAAVALGSALDAHARNNTTSVYTAPQVFPMLPERLSTDRTSLNQDEDRLVVVTEVAVDGAAVSSVYLAVVRNRAQLTYSGVGAWLEGAGDPPAAAAAVPGLVDNLRLQDRIAQGLKEKRHEQGALELETIEVRARFTDDAVSELAAERTNRAKQIIEDFMIAANGVMARFLEGHKLPVLRRVVREPERWPRIVEIAHGLGDRLPPEPDAKALDAFLLRRRAADPLRFPDLSLAVIKLLGRGEYVASFPGEKPIGHFGLAVTQYTHSTAPNRRYPDLLTQRMLKAALAGQPGPYDRKELTELATRCTQKEDDAQKVERLLRKCAAALLLSDRVGDEFEGIVTGASEKGTWVRVFDPPVEGRVEQGEAGLDVGDTVRVKLLHTDVERGYIDFARIKTTGHAPGVRPGARGTEPAAR